MVSIRDLEPGLPIAVSATLFGTYQRCPQQALARLQGVYSAPNRASFKGALAHRIFARHLTNGPILEQDFEVVCRQETGANLNGQMAAVGLKLNDFRAVVAEVTEMYDRFRSIPVEGFEAAEAPFAVEPTPGLTVRGRIDAVFSDANGTRIVDWKTGKDLGEGVVDQLAFYAWAWRLSTGAAPMRTEAMSVTTGERLVEDFTPADLGRFEVRVVEMATALRGAMETEDELERTAGPYCAWCPLLDECAEGTAAAGILS